MKPSTIALLDQARAASRDAQQLLRAVAEIADAELRHDRPGPVSRAIIARLETRLLAQDITLCPHLSWNAPAVTGWLAYAPGRLRCVSCCGNRQRAIRGTAEDRRCDSCHRVAPLIRPAVVQLRPTASERITWTECLPPIAVHFGLCSRCYRLDAAEVSDAG